MPQKGTCTFKYSAEYQEDSKKTTVQIEPYSSCCDIVWHNQNQYTTLLIVSARHPSIAELKRILLRIRRRRGSSSPSGFAKGKKEKMQKTRKIFPLDLEHVCGSRSIYIYKLVQIV